MKAPSYKFICFNSIKVQLKAPMIILTLLLLLSFNSIKVQLKEDQKLA